MLVMIQCPECLTLNYIQNTGECTKCASSIIEKQVNLFISLTKDQMLHQAPISYLIEMSDDLENSELHDIFSEIYVLLFSSLITDERIRFLKNVDIHGFNKASIDYLNALRDIYNREFESYNDAMWFIIPKWYSIMHKLAKESDEWVETLNSFKFFVAIGYIDFVMSAGYLFKDSARFDWNALSNVMSAISGTDLIAEIDVSSANTNVEMAINNPILDAVLCVLVDRDDNIENFLASYVEYKSMF